jgi:hypothetical protein
MKISNLFAQANVAKRLLLVVVLSAVSSIGQAQDLYVQDNPLDNGVEPNPDSGPMWRSPSIWVQTQANPSYSPDPFPTNTPPPWAIDAHENPEYRETKFSTPNWIYVKVSNRGSVATMGNEKLEVYWAKASTGLAWPSHWKDYYATPDGCAERLFWVNKQPKHVKMWPI